MVLRLTLEVSPAEGRPEQLTGRAVFVNEGDEEVPVMAMQLESPPLALEIVDEAGAPVPLPPPPVPDPTAEPVSIGPGDAYDATYPGFFPAWTAAGRYRVRARVIGAETAVSEWVDVTLHA
jgi:hypothetical protein